MGGELKNCFTLASVDSIQRIKSDSARYRVPLMAADSARYRVPLMAADATGPELGWIREAAKKNNDFNNTNPPQA